MESRPARRRRKVVLNKVTFKKVTDMERVVLLVLLDGCWTSGAAQAGVRGVGVTDALKKRLETFMHSDGAVR